jgi:hypothetical protein
MRITKQVLVRRWALSTLAAAAVFAVLAWSDMPPSIAPLSWCGRHAMPCGPVLTGGWIIS